MFGTCLLLLVAGHETTTRLIGNGLYTLFKHPEQFNYLKDNFELIPNAIEEIMRFEPPVHATVRFAYDDIIYADKKFKKGTILITIAANIGYSGVLEYDMASICSILSSVIIRIWILIDCISCINNFIE